TKIWAARIVYLVSRGLDCSFAAITHILRLCPAPSSADPVFNLVLAHLLRGIHVRPFPFAQVVRRAFMVIPSTLALAHFSLPLVSASTSSSWLAIFIVVSERSGSPLFHRLPCEQPFYIVSVMAASSGSSSILVLASVQQPGIMSCLGREKRLF